MPPNTRGRYRTPVQSTPQSKPRQPRDPSKYQDYLARKQAEAQQRPLPQTRGRLRTKTKTTVRRGDTLGDVAGRLGVEEQDVTQLGVKKLAPGQVIDATSATARRQAVEDAARTRNFQAEQIQAKLDNLAPGAKGPRKALQDELARLTTPETAPAEPQPEYPEFGQLPYVSVGPKETYVSQFARAIQQARIDLGIIGVDVPEKQYFAGTSPTEIEEAQRARDMARRDQEMQQFFSEYSTEPAQQAAQRGYTDMIARGNLEEMQAFQRGGRIVEDANGNEFFISDDPTSRTQRGIDADGARLSLQAIKYAMETESWDSLPTMITAGMARHMVGTPNGMSFEEMSALGYSMDAYGNWVHEVPDFEVPYNPGYGDYTGGYGGGYGGGGYEPNKNTYAGGRAQSISGQMARNDAKRAQNAGLGGASWRI